MAYRCNYCNSVFEDPVVTKNVEHHPYGECSADEVRYDLFCPECGGEDFVNYWGDDDEE